MLYQAELLVYLENRLITLTLTLTLTRTLTLTLTLTLTPTPTLTLTPTPTQTLTLTLTLTSRAFLSWRQRLDDQSDRQQQKDYRTEKRPTGPDPNPNQ